MEEEMMGMEQVGMPPEAQGQPQPQGGGGGIDPQMVAEIRKVLVEMADQLGLTPEEIQQMSDEEIMQIYDMVMSQQGGGAPGGGDPNAMSSDMGGGMPPEAGGDPMAGGGGEQMFASGGTVTGGNPYNPYMSTGVRNLEATQRQVDNITNRNLRNQANYQRLYDAGQRDAQSINGYVDLASQTLQQAPQWFRAKMAGGGSLQGPPGKKGSPIPPPVPPDYESMYGSMPFAAHLETINKDVSTYGMPMTAVGYLAGGMHNNNSSGYAVEPKGFDMERINWAGDNLFRAARRLDNGENRDVVLNDAAASRTMSGDKRLRNRGGISHVDQNEYVTSDRSKVNSVDRKVVEEQLNIIRFGDEIARQFSPWQRGLMNALVYRLTSFIDALPSGESTGFRKGLTDALTLVNGNATSIKNDAKDDIGAFGQKLAALLGSKLYYNKVFGEVIRELMPIWLGQARDMIETNRQMADGQTSGFRMPPGKYNGVIDVSNAARNKANAAVEYGRGFKGTRRFAGGGVVPVEVEGGETIQTPNGQVQQVQGPRHEQGGVPADLPSGTNVYSDRVGIGGDTMAQRKNERTKKVDNIIRMVEAYPKNPVYRKTLAKYLELYSAEDALDMEFQEAVKKSEGKGNG